MIEELRKKYWDMEGDDILHDQFPNHSDQDVWNRGFDAAVLASKEIIDSTIENAVVNKNKKDFICKYPDEPCHYQCDECKNDEITGINESNLKNGIAEKPITGIWDSEEKKIKNKYK
jgi:hypothetical protein